MSDDEEIRLRENCTNLGHAIIKLQEQFRCSQQKLAIANGQIEDLEAVVHTCPTCGESCIECQCMRDKLAAAERREKALEDAVKWYGEIAESLARNDWKKNPDYAEPIFVELSLDGGRRAADVLRQGWNAV